MSNRYEREIEEILRKLEDSDPKRPGSTTGARTRPRPEPRPIQRRRSPIALNFTTAEWLLVGAVTCALIAGGFAYAMGDVIKVYTGILAIVGFICIVLVALSQILLQTRRPRPMHYGNVTITPLRRSPLHTLKTRWNLFMLKWRYRRKGDRPH